MTARGAGASQLAVLADGPAEDPAAAAAAAAVLVLGAGGETAGRAAWRLAALLDAGFLAGAGWDPVTWVLSPPAAHQSQGTAPPHRRYRRKGPAVTCRYGKNPGPSRRE